MPNYKKGVSSSLSFGENLQICFWQTDTGGFAICGLIIKTLQISDFRTCTPKKFADLRLRDEAKNFKICNLRQNKIACPFLLYLGYHK
jgi:hypothetical protein